MVSQPHSKALLAEIKKLNPATLATHFSETLSLEQLAVALDTLDCGFVLFDAQDRLLFCNQKYREILHHIAHLLTPGRSLEELLRVYYRSGTVHEAAAMTEDEFVRDRLARRKETPTQIVVGDSGRYYLVIDQRLPDGGSIGLRYDITERKLIEDMLHQRERIAADIAELSYDWYWRQDAQLRFVEVSGGLTRYTKIDRSVWFGKTRWELPVVNADQTDWQAHKQLLAERKPFTDFSYQVRTELGELRWFSASGKPLFNEAGEFVGYHGIARDITEQKSAALRLKESEERYRALTELSSDWYWEQDEQLRFTQLSQGVSRINLPIEAILGKRRWELPIYGGNDSFWEEHKALLAERKSFRNFVYAAYSRDGKLSWFSVSGEPVFDKNGTFRGYHGIGSDITSRIETETKVKELAHRDVLTGLPNRTLLNERLQHAIASAERLGQTFAVLFLDLDHFRTINNTLGHAVGDELLRAVANRLLNCVRQVDTVCRQGGDEFIVLLTMVQKPTAAARVAEKILQELSQPLVLQGKEITVSASIGISLYPEDGQEITALLKNADTAMYYTKNKGRNSYQFFTSAMNERVVARLAMENRLRQAIMNKELHLAYQPQVSLKSGAIIGIEALLRWYSPEHGSIPPAQFIPIAEETGLIVPIGEWVLSEACKQNRLWMDEGFPLVPIAVNVSAVQFQQKDFPRTVSRILAESRLLPNLLELEFTESMLMRDAQSILSMLQHLNAMGVRLAIDDFGIGYSSLNYLKRFAMDKLKIDQSFISDCVHDSQDATITAAIISLGKTLGLSILAEGVESKEQLAFLQQHDCDDVQGYWFSPPLAADALTHLLRIGKRLDPLPSPWAGLIS